MMCSKAFSGCYVVSIIAEIGVLHKFILYQVKCNFNTMIMIYVALLSTVLLLSIIDVPHYYVLLPKHRMLLESFLNVLDKMCYR